MQPIPAAQSGTVLALRALPMDANPAGNVHGGVLLRNIDLAAAAMRHCRCRVVTRSVDRVEFRAPAQVGEVISFKARVNLAGSTSMEVGVRVEAEDLLSALVRHVASAYLTFVAMDQDGRPTSVPPLQTQSPEDERRQRQAQARRERRRQERQQEARDDVPAVAPSPGFAG